MISKVLCFSSLPSTCTCVFLFIDEFVGEVLGDGFGEGLFVLVALVHRVTPHRDFSLLVNQANAGRFDALHSRTVYKQAASYLAAGALRLVLDGSCFYN